MSCPRCHPPVASQQPTTCRSRLAAWLIPGAVFAVVPKCPACVAAYVALATGVSLSWTAAAWLRFALIAVCCLICLLLAIKPLRRLLSHRPAASLSLDHIFRKLS
ncbi:hypothetical protein [Planctomicrobium piriforme]|uniref:Uncharacterized protein n=1 Tax=Planctomicrobium piriforme TaxID=1576369 RepID=A0A1I3T566_9PLAN|nr:hypothetical protein [Planctomicrobium piriforme]SFJ65369.1 hypothetical protein SAMN05421753_12726 [Planctomicrobium piriforme]